MFRNYARLQYWSVVAVLPAAFAAALLLAGCERRERVIEVDTPGADITVDRVEQDDADRIEIEVDRQ